MASGATPGSTPAITPASGFKEKKEDEQEAPLPFQHLEKGLVLQEKRVFNESPLNTKKCALLLTKVLYLLVQGDRLTTNEATDLFFAITKLFQSKDIPLRRLVFLTLKELSPLAESVIIVIASLTKDMNSKIDVFRSNAIRVLCKIADPSILSQAERYLKQAIVDKDPAVASAALVSGLHLIQQPANADIVKRWVAELQDALKSRNAMVQYHALGLLAQLRQHDRLALSKLVLALVRAPGRSPHAQCLLVRYAAQVMQELQDPADVRTLYEFLEGSLRHKSEVVMYEAARAMCQLPGISARDLIPAISVLQLFLSSLKPTIRFAAARTLNRVANTHPLVVSSCNVDLENLIGDPNRSIATMAITTLLKTGSESSIERLMKQISNFMGEISDEFKVVVIEAIRALAIKFPAKHRAVLAFLAGCLREEGGFEFKNSIVSTMVSLIAAVPDAKELALGYLCEFIEDCEFAYLTVKILYLLGREGPLSPQPSRHIRFIYNRVILENANVRAAAVVTLAKFAAAVPSLRPAILVLLARCAYDNDDEVRDRATLYQALLADGPDAADTKLVDELLVRPGELLPPLENLEAALQRYQASAEDAPFSLDSVSLEPVAAPAPAPGTKAAAASSAPAAKAAAAAAAAAAGGATAESTYREQLAAIPAFATFGPLFKSAKAQELTEREVEYTVSVVKHVFAAHVVLQFNVTNTLKDIQLLDVRAKLDLSSLKGALVPHSAVPLPSLGFDLSGATYVALRLVGEPLVGSIGTKLVFKVREAGEEEASGEDEYQVEDVALVTSDYVARALVHNFAEAWEAAKEQAEVVDTYALQSIKNLPDAVKEITDYLGMQPCDGSDVVSGKKHVLFLAGQFLGGARVLVRARMFIDPAHNGVALELAIRSPAEKTCRFISQAI